MVHALLMAATHRALTIRLNFRHRRHSNCPHQLKLCFRKIPLFSNSNANAFGLRREIRARSIAGEGQAVSQKNENAIWRHFSASCRNGDKFRFRLG